MTTPVSAPHRRPWLLLLAAGLLGLLILAAGCRRKASAPAAAAPKEYALTGEVVAVVPERGAILVHHQAIPGYMPAMTMEFTCDAADRAKLAEGRHLRGCLTDDGKGNLHLGNIVVLDEVKEREIQAAATMLRQDTSERGGGAYREIGETVPSFALYNQNGDVVTANRFRGHRVVLNFIYTRCPIATMCPASTARMQSLQRAAREQGVANLELVTISLDPVYDTPAVLRDYAAARGIDTANFSFLTGPEGAVRDLLAQFGIITEPGENYLKHTLATLLIDEKGRIVHRVDGTQWTPDEFLHKLK